MTEQHKPKLSDARLKALHREPKPGKHSDGTVPGLYVECTAAGNLLWRLKYRLAGKENRAALGAYPDVGLAEARRRGQEARTLVASGQAPVEHKRAQQAAQEARAAQSFEVIARKWLESRRGKITDTVLTRYQSALEQRAFPHVGRTPVADVTLSDALQVVRLVGDKPAAARQIMRLTEQVLEFAEAHSLTDRNVLAGRRQTKTDALPRSRKVNRAALLQPAQVGDFLRAVEGFKTRTASTVADALRLLPLLAVRPGELCSMRWADVDLDAGVWRYTMPKVGEPHTVYLPQQAVELLQGLQERTGGGEWVFPSDLRPRAPVGRAALLAAMRRLGFSGDEVSAHGWRATFRTLGAEVLGIEPDVLELALGHKLRDAHRGAYNRVKLEAARRDCTQRWADYLDQLKAGAQVSNVVLLKRG